MMELQATDNVLTLFLDGNIYSEAVLFKCFYWYSGTFSVEIIPFELGKYKIVLTARETSVEWDSIIPKIKGDLVDFKLGQIVTEETKTIRELIVAKAFAYYEQDEYPQSQITDPVGFNPQNV